MTPSSQQTAAIFLLHARSFLKYFSRQQGGTKRKTVEENSEDLLTMMNEIRLHHPLTYVGGREVDVMEVKSQVSLVISRLPQYTKEIKR